MTILTAGSASGAFADSKRHYPILDGLRGVAALMVVAFHLFEAHAASRFEQLINHGYLAVDFFFVLSGFVIGYAYDERWSSMSTREFFQRRLIRLHPMIVLAMLIGAAMYYLQTGPVFPMIEQTPLWQMLLVMLIGISLLPVGASLDIRGWGEMHPLNGPAWSLYYEYVANILYALWVRKFSNTVLALCAAVSGAVLLHYCVAGPNGDVIGGWSLQPAQIRIGLTRLLYPFFAGLLLARVVSVGRVRHAFLLSSLIMLAVLAWPRVGDASSLWQNGLYEALCILLVFPLVVYLGASGSVQSGAAARLCASIGALSYPLYIIHYPMVYTYTAWVARNKITLSAALPWTIATFLICVGLAYVCLHCYDIPLRRWLSGRLASRPAGAAQH